MRRNKNKNKEKERERQTDGRPKMTRSRFVTPRTVYEHKKKHFKQSLMLLKGVKRISERRYVKAKRTPCYHFVCFIYACILIRPSHTHKHLYSTNNYQPPYFTVILKNPCVLTKANWKI